MLSVLGNGEKRDKIVFLCNVSCAYYERDTFQFCLSNSNDHIGEKIFLNRINLGSLTTPSDYTCLHHPATCTSFIHYAEMVPNTLIIW